MFMPSMLIERFSLVPQVAMAVSTAINTALHLDTVSGDAMTEMNPLSTATISATVWPSVLVAIASNRTRLVGIASVCADVSASTHAPSVPPVQACVIGVGVANRYVTPQPEAAV